MPFHIVQTADVECLQWLGEQFRRAARRGARLLHVTRVLLDPEEEALTHTERDWQEFIPDNNPFTFGVHHRLGGGIQQSCFYGDESHLDSFMALALSAGNSLPDNFLRLRARKMEFRSRAHDWVLAAYHIAVRSDGRIPLRYSEPTPESPRDGSAVPWPWSLAADFDRDLEADQEDLTRWHAEPSKQRKKKVRYVYAALQQDVFSASALAIDHLLTHAATLYQPYVEQAIGGKPNTPGVPLSTAQQSDVQARDLARHPNIARDAWMHDLAVRGSTYKAVLAELKRIVTGRNWRPLGSERAVREAVNRYRQRHLKLPALTRRGGA